MFALCGFLKITPSMVFGSPVVLSTEFEYTLLPIRGYWAWAGLHDSLWFRGSLRVLNSASSVSGSWSKVVLGSHVG